jgi:hypothetical protein
MKKQTETFSVLTRHRLSRSFYTTGSLLSSWLWLKICECRTVDEYNLAKRKRIVCTFSLQSTSSLLHAPLIMKKFFDIHKKFSFLPQAKHYQQQKNKTGRNNKGGDEKFRCDDI